MKKTRLSLSTWFAWEVGLASTTQKQSPVRSLGLRERILLLRIPSTQSHFGKHHPSPQCRSSLLGKGTQGLPLCPRLSQLLALPYRCCRYNRHPPWHFWLDIKTVPVAVVASSGSCSITGSSGQ